MSAEAGEAVRTGGDGARAVLGLDIGGTKIAAGVVDADGGVHGFVTAPSDPDSSSGVPIAELAAEAFGRPAVLDNDATAGAAGEHRYGAGRGTHAMVYLTISTGVGGGVVLDGAVQRGRSGNGGELGHVTVDWHGRRCRGCGRRGCLEAYCSGTSIAERAVEAGMDDGVTAADVAQAARAGNEIASRVWDETCEALACGLTSIANLFEPEVIVLGGGVVRTGEQLLAPVRTSVAEQMIGPSVSIVAAASGDAVGVVGAAAIAYERVHR